MPAEALETPITSSPGLTVPTEGTAVGGDVAPYTMQNAVTASEGGSFSGGGVGYSPTLGSHLRARYNSESYGQLDGNFDLGTMKMWQPDRDSAWFVDGQVTLNDESKVGYNVGVGYRWMTLPVFPWSPDREKIAGLSIWSDGSSAGGENFFPQVGISAELLGDTWDFRANAYIPVGPESQTRDFRPTGNNVFFGNFLGSELIGIRDTALTGGEVEVARRIRDLDAWVFGGAYGFDGGGFDTAGGRYGLRGYVTPDILAQFQMTHDELFDTNAVVGLTWFIGRTRNNTALTCTLRDRFREPVLRNDYVAMVQSTATSASDPLENIDGDAQRFVHVDSTAAAGGDGSFERPLNQLGTIQANSQEGDIILAHAGSNLTGSVATLQNDQQFFGEGGGRTASFSAFNSSGAPITITAPETAPGAIDGVVPILNGVAGQATVTLADDNLVENLTFTGGQNAIINGATGSANPNLQRLTINNTTGDGIVLDAFDRVDTDDTDNDENVTETFNILGNVVINRVTFNNVMGNDIQIDADTSATTNNGETIDIDNITSNGNVTDRSILISNTNNTTGDVTNIDNFTYNGGALGDGAIRLVDTAGPVNINTSTLTGGAGPAVDIERATGSVSVGSTTTIRDVIGTAVRVVDTEGNVTIASDVITANTVNGGTVLIQNNEGIVNVNGDITANNADAVNISGAQAAITFGSAGTITHSGTGTAIKITDDADTTTDDGEITFAGDITNSQGRVVDIGDDDNTIGTGDDNITFTGDINDTGSGIRVRNRVAGTTLFNNQTTLSTGANTAVDLIDNDEDSSVDFNNLDITTSSGAGLVSNGDGEINITGNSNTITTGTGQAIAINGGSSTSGLTFSNVTTGTVAAGLDAVSVENFDGTVTINDGALNTSGAGDAVNINDANFAMTGVNITTGAGNAVTAVYDGTTARTLNLNTVNLGDKNVSVSSTSSGGATVTMNTITKLGDVSLSTAAGTGALTTTMTTVSSDATTNADGSDITLTTATGAGTLTMNTVTGVDDIDLNANGSGNLSTTMNTVTSSTTGNITLDVAGTGNGTLNMNTVNTAGTVAANSAGGSTGALTVTSNGSGGTTALGAISMNDGGNGAASLTLNNTTSSAGVTFDSAFGGDATFAINGGSYTGVIDAAATNAGAFNATVDGPTTLTSGRIVFNAGNAGTTTMVVRDMTYSTAGAAVGIDIQLGSGVTTGNVTVQNNTVTSVTGEAFRYDANGGDVNFLLDNNRFTNNSNAQNTALVDISGTGETNLTVTNNTFTSTNGGSLDEFGLFMSSGSPTVNLNLTSNTAEDPDAGANSGEIDINEASGTLGIFQRSNTFTNVPVRNNANLTFDKVEAGYDDLPSAPDTP